MCEDCMYWQDKLKRVIDENEQLRKLIEDYSIEIEHDIEKKKEIAERIQHALDRPMACVTTAAPLNTNISYSFAQSEKRKISLEEATLIAKEFFAKIKGEPSMAGRRYIDQVGFDVIEAKEKEKEEEEQDRYSIVCEVGQSLFTHEKDRFEVEISLYGELLSEHKVAQNNRRTDKKLQQNE